MAVALPLSVLPGISLSRGEIDKRKAPHFLSICDDASCEWKSVRQVISPLEGEMSCRTEGGKRRTLRGQTHAR